MNISKVVKFAKINLPTILTITGAAGVGVTTALAIKDTQKFEAIKAGIKDKKDFVVKVVKTYAPTIISGTATIGCIFGANHASRRQIKALAAIAATTGASLTQLREAIKTTPPEIQEKIEEEYAKQIRQKAPIEIPSADAGEDLYYEEHYGYFTAKPEKITAALQELNERLVCRNTVYLNEFFEMLGFNDPIVEGLETIGWNVFEIGCNSQYSLVNADITEGTPLDPFCECEQHTIKWNTPPQNNPEEEWSEENLSQ